MKKLATLLCIFSLAVFTVGCGGDDEPDTAAGSKAVEAEEKADKEEEKADEKEEMTDEVAEEATE